VLDFEPSGRGKGSAQPPGVCGNPDGKIPY